MTKKVEDFMEQAKVKYQEQVDFEIRKIARKLLEEHESAENRKIQDKCPHENTSSYNHGRYEVCNDCGKDL